jgi:hypothetical protein
MLFGMSIAFLLSALVQMAREHSKREACADDARREHEAAMDRLRKAQDEARDRLQAMIDVPPGHTLRIVSVVLAGLLISVAGAVPTLAADAAATQAAELAAIQRHNLIEIAWFLGICSLGMGLFVWWILREPASTARRTHGFALVVTGTLAALALFAQAHRLMAFEAANMEERAAYMVWQGQCERAEVLCGATALEYLDGGPAPATRL